MIEDVIRRAEQSSDAPERASSRLKSRIFSTLVAMQQAEGPLRTQGFRRTAGA